MCPLRSSVLRLSFGCALGFSGGFCGAQSDSFKIASPVEEVREWPFQIRWCAGVMLLDGEFADGRACTFLLDTGSAYCVVDDDLADVLAEQMGHELQQSDIRGHDAAGEQFTIGYTVELEAMTLGGVRFPWLPCVLIDLDRMSEAAGQRIDGILGYHAFAHLALEIDYRAGRVKAYSRGPDPREGDVVLPLEIRSVPFVAGTIDGHEVDLLIDTGATDEFSVPQELFNELPALSGPGDVAIASSITGAQTITALRLDGQVRLGSVTWADPILVASPGQSRIGAHALRNTKIVIDGPGRRVLISTDLPFNLIPPDEELTFPVLLSPTRDGWTVVGAKDGRTLEEFGLEAGDQVTHINGLGPAELKCRGAAAPVTPEADHAVFTVARDGETLLVRVPVESLLSDR